MELREALQAAQQVIHKEGQQFFASYKPQVAGIDRWSEDIVTRLEEYCLRPGKAVRPLLIAVGYALARSCSLSEALENTQVRILMLAYELTHKRILMADDIADNDDLRNEKPAFHVQMEQDLATREAYSPLSPQKRAHFARSYTEVAGIWLQTLSFAVIEKANLSPEVRNSVLRTLLQCVYEKTPAGWYILLDQNLEKLDERVSEERFLKGLELVTGEYTFVAPLTLGAVLGSLQEAERLAPSIANLGAAAGILFQLTDDRIGLFGDPKETGKPVGNDIREGKKTLYMLYAYARASDGEKAFLQSIVGSETVTQKDLVRVQEIVHQTGAYDRVEQKITQYAQAAKKEASRIYHSEVSRLLIEMLEYISARTK